MPSFTFVAADAQGNPVSGSRQAASRQELIARLRAENMLVTSVTEDSIAPVLPASVSEVVGQWRETFTKGRIRTNDLLIFTRQLGAMLKAGVSLTDAFQTVAHSVGSERLRGILMEVRTDIQRGRTLTDALRCHPEAFDPLFISIVHAGETSGSLSQNVARLTAYLDRREKFRRKVKSATAYPKFVMGFFTLLTAGIFLFIFPKFQAIFAGFGAKLPPLTQTCIDISQFLRSYLILILPALAVLVFGLIVLRNTRVGRVWFDRAVLRMPFFGAFFLQAALARLSMTLSTLLSNGIPLTDALQTATATMNNTVLEAGMRNVRRDVMKGDGLAESLGRVQEFPKLLSRMARVGEESGTLSGMLEDVANYYDQEVDFALGRITALIEPILIIGMGVVVLITVLAIYLPIFNIGKVVGGGG